ncbi:MAG: glycosyltransferase family 2 protein [Flavobacteriales bacterium]|nr:glycosyltransferase family 2 protein [Flavobacteriales bacterium]
MSKTPLVSVVMPNYNNELYLVEAVESILEQTFTDFEFLIIDDGSTDKSIEIINSYKDPRIKLIVKEKNSGIVDSLNLGIEAAVGKYMIRMDGDDISVLTRFERLVAFMEGHPLICVCSTDMQSFDKNGDVNIWRYGKSIMHNKAEMIFRSAIGHASSIFRMNLFTDHKIRYEKGYPYIEDYKLFTRLNKLGDMNNLSDPLYKVRLNDASSTALNRDTHAERLNLIYRELLSELDINLDETEESIDKLKVHFEISTKRKLSHSYGEYDKWCKILTTKNIELDIYPKKEFEEIIEARLHWVKYNLISQNASKYWGILMYNKSIDLALFRYYLGVKLKKD